MPYRIAGIDGHKKILAVVIADVGVDGKYQFVRQRVGTSPNQLRALATGEHVATMRAPAVNASCGRTVVQARPGFGSKGISTSA
jgi:hypothetical protein